MICMGRQCNANNGMKTKIKSVWYIFVEVINKRRRLGSWLWLSLFYWSDMKICITKSNESFEVEVASGPLLVDSMMFRGGSRAAATSKTECFVIIVNGWKPLLIITKHSVLDVAAGLGSASGALLLLQCEYDQKN